jgi:formyltetrahydrofolate deformylase
MQQCLLVFTCKDMHGIIAKVTTFLSTEKAFIRELSEFGDPVSGTFFLRCHFQFKEQVDLDVLTEKFQAVASHFQAQFRFVEPHRKPKTIILVSKFGHCLNDLLYRADTERLDLDVLAVISNHEDLKPMAEHYKVPYLYIPVSEKTKQAAEEKLEDIIEKNDIELVILARYMQILSPTLTRKYFGKIINIHHSFLPSFKGAKPYHQAFDRGVKIIGATAHYVTENLDEGPIIEQEVLRVDHVRTLDELISVGFDVEAQVLARAVKYHTQYRIFFNNNKTVIFK